MNAPVTRLRPKEAPIVRDVLRLLGARGAWCWRVNSGTFALGDGTRWFRAAPAGTPDVIGVLRGGRLFALEVKAPGGRLQQSQRDWLKRAESYGVACAVVYSAAEALRVYEGWVRG